MPKSAIRPIPVPWQIVMEESGLVEIALRLEGEDSCVKAKGSFVLYRLTWQEKIFAGFASPDGILLAFGTVSPLPDSLSGREIMRVMDKLEVLKELSIFGNNEAREFIFETV